jgi:hypothetical protein
MNRPDMIDGLPPQSAPLATNSPTLEQLARGCRIAQKMWMRYPTPAARLIMNSAEKLLDSALDQLASLRGSGLVGEGDQ